MSTTPRIGTITREDHPEMFQQVIELVNLLTFAIPRGTKNHIVLSATALLVQQAFVKSFSNPVDQLNKFEEWAEFARTQIMTGGKPLN